MSARPSASSAAKANNAENRMVKKREKEHEHQMECDDQVQYYKSCDRTNKKFQEWTSSHYGDANNQMIEDLKKKRQRKELLEKRREKLRKLLEEENRTYNIEVMGKSRYNDERKRHKAEFSLYHEQRNNNPELREHESLSSASKQVQKGLETERAEECQQMLAKRAKRLEEEQERRQKAITAEHELDLEKKFEELQIKQKQNEVLQKEEEDEAQKLRELFDIEDRHQAEEKLRENREMALENLNQHKMKLKQKAAIVQIDHENSVKLVAEYDRDIRKNREDKQHQKEEWKKEIDAQIEDNRVRKQEEKIREQRQIDREEESARSRIFF